MKRIRIGAAMLFAAFVVACSGGGTNVPSSTGAAQQGRTAAPAQRHFIIPKNSNRHRQDASGNLIDGGFESGGTTNWQQCGSVNASVTTAQAHSGSYSELNGQVSTPEINGDAGLCQEVTVPSSGSLTFWVYEGTNERSTTYSYQEADFLDSTGAVITNFFTEATTTNGWVKRTYDISAYAGQDVWIYFGVHADGYGSDYIYQYVDDVAWSGSATPTPQPTATPTVKPTATPTNQPTATPTNQPTATPTAKPTATPTNAPTPTPTVKPTATPTAKPTATPTPGGGPTPFPTPAGSGPHGSSCGTSCGVQRWHIKTLDDAQENLINWNPVLTSVTSLASAPVPSGYDQYNDTSRYAPYERQVYTVRAILVGWKIESDHDFHMVIADPNNTSSTMIVEPPDPACSAACDSGFGSIFTNTRAKMTNCFGQPSTSFVNFSNTIVVDVTGVALFDALHGQTGVAPNGIELHPLLNINFVSGAPGC